MGKNEEVELSVGSEISFGSDTVYKVSTFRFHGSLQTTSVGLTTAHFNIYHILNIMLHGVQAFSVCS